MKNLLLFLGLSIFCLNVTAQNWVQLGDTFIGEVNNDKLGEFTSLSADGNTVAIGGQVKVYTYNGTTWSPKGNAISQPGSVKLSADGNTVAIGSTYDNRHGGQVSIFDFDGSDWVQRGATLITGTGSVSSGRTDISADGNRVVLSFPGYNNNRGQIKAFGWNGSSWQQLGSDINGFSSGDRIGFSISLSADGNTFITGTPYTWETFDEDGEIRIYNFNGTEWIQKARWAGFTYIGHLGSDVGINADGSNVVIGEENYNQMGRTGIYSWNGTKYLRKGSDITGLGNYDQNGKSVAINGSGNIIISAGTGIGSLISDGNARVFKFEGADWEQLGPTFVGQDSEKLGAGLAINASGNTIALGSPGENNNKGALRVYRYDGPLGISENNLETTRFYPNPTFGDFTIDLGKEYKDVSVQIYNMLGQIISSKKYASAKIISKEIKSSAGVYFVKVSTVKEGSKTLRVIKQ